MNKTLLTLSLLLGLAAVGKASETAVYIYDGKQYSAKERQALLVLVHQGNLSSRTVDTGTMYTNSDGIDLVCLNSSEGIFLVPTTITPDNDLSISLTSSTQSWTNLKYPNLSGVTKIHLRFRVAVNAQNFPDENFRNYVLAQSYGSDAVLTKEEIADVTNIGVVNLNISDLKGIEYFTALTMLVCYPNKLTTLDVSKNTKLTYLNCGGNQLTKLDVSGCTELVQLECHYNQLKSLDLSNNTKLGDLECHYNQLTTLDLSKNTKLRILQCSGNQLTSLDLSGCTALKELDCYNNQIQGKGMATLVNSLPNVAGGKFAVYDTDGTEGNEITTAQVATAKKKGWSVQDANGSDYPGVDLGIAIDVTNFPDPNFRAYVSGNTIDKDGDGYLSTEEIAGVTEIKVREKSISDLKGIEHFTALTKLDCAGNQLNSLDVSKNTALKELICNHNRLTTLDISNNTALTHLECHVNQLTSLDVSKNTALTNLQCHYNRLTSLDVSKNTALTTLYCNNNQLTSLDVSKNTVLKDLYCSSNKLTVLDVSKNLVLADLTCGDNQLTSLDVSNNTALTTLYCYKNLIRGASMAALINSLPDRSATWAGSLHVYYNEEGNGNIMTTVQVAAAKAKNWMPKQYISRWIDFDGVNIEGDANGDGEVNALDIETVRDYILGRNPQPFSLKSADLNYDEVVDIVDLTLLIEMMK